MPDSRTIVRGAIIGLGLVALVAVSVLAGRLTSQQEPASAQDSAAAEATPAAGDDVDALLNNDPTAHDHGGGGENPYLVKPDEPIEPWSETVTYTDPDGNTFTVLVELEEPNTAGMGMCSMGPMAGEYNRTVVLSVRNDGDKPATGPHIGVTEKRIGFPHADGMGCSWVYPSGVDGEYAPGDAKTFRGLLKTEPVDQDAVLVVRQDKKELLRIPANAFADA
jgi:hypothetical protein